MQDRHLDFALSYAISMSINLNKCYESSVSFNVIVIVRNLVSSQDVFFLKTPSAFYFSRNKEIRRWLMNDRPGMYD